MYKVWRHYSSWCTARHNVLSVAVGQGVPASVTFPNALIPLWKQYPLLTNTETRVDELSPLWPAGK